MKLWFGGCGRTLLVQRRVDWRVGDDVNPSLAEHYNYIQLYTPGIIKIRLYFGLFYDPN